MLKRSSFRSKFKLTDRDRQYIQDKGIETIKNHAFDFINSRIAPKFPKNDGKQTPMKGHPVFIAQHATRNLLPWLFAEMAKDTKGQDVN